MAGRESDNGSGGRIRTRTGIITGRVTNRMDLAPLARDARDRIGYRIMDMMDAIRDRAGAVRDSVKQEIHELIIDDLASDISDAYREISLREMWEDVRRSKWYRTGAFALTLPLSVAGYLVDFHARQPPSPAVWDMVNIGWLIAVATVAGTWVNVKARELASIMVKKERRMAAVAEEEEIGKVIHVDFSGNGSGSGPAS